MFRRAVSTSAQLLAFAFVLVAGVAAADGGPNRLDGKRFAIEVTDPGGNASQDTLVFADGQFRSVASEREGFGPTRYATQAEWEDGDEFGLEFQAVAESPDRGTKRWYGMLEGDRIQGAFTWQRAGEEPREYTFEGAVGPP
jgi:hypothetical protein